MMSNMDFTQQVFEALQQKATPERASGAYRYFQAFPGGYAEGDRFIGVTVPDQRAVAKQFSTLAEATDISALLNSVFHEMRLTGLYILVSKFQKSRTEEAKKMWVNLYLDHLNGINNWDLVDSSCYHILGKWLEDKPRDLLYELADSPDIWHNRIAIITCMSFIRRNDFVDAFALIEKLLYHRHDLIHKASGWMLREIGERDRQAEEAFLLKYYHVMPRTALRYAIEKFEPERRKAYLNGTA
jgi:3-methyladenine DNA glycosylase AlkD